MGSTFRSSGARGFTLLELMIVIGLAAVIMAIGAPSFTEFRRNARLTAPANDFLAATQLARTEAAKRQRVVSICPSATGGTLNPTCGDGDFTGWVVFEDPNRDCARSGAEAVVASQASVNDPDVTATFRVTARANGGCVTLAPSGYIDTAAIVPSLTRVLFCDVRGIASLGGANVSAARGVVVEPNGRARVTRDADIIASWGLACP